MSVDARAVSRCSSKDVVLSESHCLKHQVSAQGQWRRDPLRPSNADGRFDIARANLRSTATEAVQVVERQHGAQALEQKGCKKVTLATSLLTGSDASEWQANKLKNNGDEVGAHQASEDAVTLRRMASEAAVTERRQSIHLVPPIDQE